MQIISNLYFCNKFKLKFEKQFVRIKSPDNFKKQQSKQIGQQVKQVLYQLSENQTDTQTDRKTLMLMMIMINMFIKI
ncbi:hypothetical protein TTHERM_00433740 (macronuclear) [Tetrahymena thermophila SB210]|uniref:Uncharacterized protein n=1 Tax=Tetrahymena thermophila (strain SB210) TaxID=312017 RepID=Q230Y5_TETTS|nr:hypothetical protein TTHERM_00433740 [Tetrahymena thermophila SB210]EAR91154.2 hypothetical protein TTHERM_00433740 [Tetrahymena thermophila SB210]|eukprot:XP_001011399.2 hypothetical protein TTHERM_00433740 [Tetrahymena thermophila SB210]